MEKKHYNIPVFISHFGCPNACVFCNQKKINGRETDVTLEDLEKIIEEYLEILPKDSYKEVAFLEEHLQVYLWKSKKNI